ncbi:MAG: hypothetical protein WA152_01465 [Microgenomates group bacterium]
MTKDNNNVKVAGAGILGAVIGAAVGAGAVALSNEKNQKFIKNKFNDLKEKGQKVLNDIQTKADELTATGKEKVKEVKKDIKAKL